jgi:hypothetical protein
MKTVIRKVAGVVLIIIGLAALLTPLTPGSWLALIGLELLGIRLLVFKKFFNDKQRAAISRFMAKFGFSSSDGSNDKPDKKER